MSHLVPNTVVRQRIRHRYIWRTSPKLKKPQAYAVSSLTETLLKRAKKLLEKKDINDTTRKVLEDVKWHTPASISSGPHSCFQNLDQMIRFYQRAIIRCRWNSSMARQLSMILMMLTWVHLHSVQQR